MFLVLDVTRYFCNVFFNVVEAINRKFSEKERLFNILFFWNSIGRPVSDGLSKSSNRM